MKANSTRPRPVVGKEKLSNGVKEEGSDGDIIDFAEHSEEEKKPENKMK